MKQIEITKRHEYKKLTIKELYDMLTPLVEKEVDGNLVAHGFYLSDDVIYDEDSKILFFSVFENWFEEQEKIRKDKEEEDKKSKPTIWQRIKNM